MPLKFCANLSTMYQTLPFHKRLYEAKAMGFKRVEAQFLYDHNLDELAAAQIETGLEFRLINSPARLEEHPEDTFGLASVPGQEVVFMDTIKLAVKYAKQLKCHKIHVIGGKKLPSQENHDGKSEAYKVYVSNIQKAANYLEKNDITLLIEPMSNPDYFLDSFDQAVTIIDEVDCSNVKLLLDVYHMHKVGMNVQEDIPKYLKYTGHIQVSQSPLRQEPFFPGEINYEKVFQVLKEKYHGDIGLEYFPSALPDSYDWVKSYCNAIE